MSQVINPLPFTILGAASVASGPSLVSQATAAQPEEIQEMNDAFVREQRPHALLITNHGYPGPDKRWPATGPDSGGQIKYVNMEVGCLTELGYKVTVAARSFVPDEEMGKEYGDRMGVDFFEGNPLARYVYVPGTQKPFMWKEHLFAEVVAQANRLAHFIRDEAASQGINPWDYVAFINSHYWDGGVMGQLLVREWQQEIVLGRIMEAVKRAGGGVELAGFPLLAAGLVELLRDDEELAKELFSVNRHVWTPHSIGTLKQANMDNEEIEEEDPKILELKKESFEWEYRAMNFPMREEVERGLLNGALMSVGLYPYVPPARIVAYTSVDIKEHVERLGVTEGVLLYRFPPGTEVDRFYPRNGVGDRDVQMLFDYLEGKLEESERVVPEDVVRRMREESQSLNVIVEASRLEKTKRKHLVIEALAHLPENTIALITGKSDKKGVYKRLKSLIAELGLENRAFIIGKVPDELMGPLCSLPHGTNPDQFHMAIGAGASRMEGWGMSVMDQTAGGLPLVSSAMTPYAVYIKQRGDAAIVIGQGAGEVQRYADAFRSLIDDPEKARAMAERGRLLAAEFDWFPLTKGLVELAEPTFGSE
jgi:glycosyltransferase involved in cell wall biosynthesis